MTDLLVSLSSNVLKVTYQKKDGFGGFSSEIPNSIVKKSEILDTQKFAESLNNLCLESAPEVLKNASISFLVDPDDVFLYFVSVNKNSGDIEDQMISSVKSKLPSGLGMEDLFFSYQKISPFIYQFVAIKKEELEKLLDISNALGMSLKSVVPWVLLLPKLVNDNKPSIFISKTPDGKQSVALSELGGIYFAQTYDQEKSQQELESLVQQLSVYNRSAPISKIYTVNYGVITLGDNYEVLPLDVSGDSAENEGYETHLLYSEVLSRSPELLSCQFNLLNLLPVPVEQKTGLKVAQTAAIVGPMVAVMLVGGFLFLKNREPVENGNVLSEVSESTQSEVVETPQPVEVEEEPKAELKKEDLKIRVENGTNVAGLAGKTRDFLNGLEYDVLSVGDSDLGDQEKTTLSFKESKKDYEPLLSDDVKDEYSTQVEFDLDEGSEYDVLITVGSSE